MAILDGVMNESGRVVIVGGGILGTMHAVLARRHGYAVTQLEREPAGRGASVRNFGLVWVSGRRAGPELALALRARALWEEIAAGAPGTGFRPAGSLTIATSDAELAVMREAVALPDAKQREFELLAPDEVRSVNPALRGEILGGLYCRADAIVEPRVTLPALRASLAGPSTSGCPGSKPSRWRRTGCATTRRLAPGRPGGALHRGELHRPGRAASAGVRGARRAADTGGAEPSRAAAGPAADAADAAVRGDADHGAGRRRLAPLLPRLRRALPLLRCPQQRSPPPAARSCCWCSASTGR